jgi:glycosidase
MTLLLTMRGIPQVYYGTEILMKNYSNPDGLVRSDFPGGWKGDKSDKFTPEGRTAAENDAYNYFRTLANFRKKNEAIQTGKLMQYVPEDGIYVYFRYTPSKTVMIVINTEEKEKQLTTSRFNEQIGNASTANNVITGEKLNQINTITVPAKGSMVLELN